MSESERTRLERLSRSQVAPAAQVIRARALLAVSGGLSFKQAAQQVGHASGDTVASWVGRFNNEGLDAVIPRHGGGPKRRYTNEDRAKIVEIAKLTPTVAKDGVRNWTLDTLRKSLDQRGLPVPSKYTLWRILRDAGFDWQEKPKPSRAQKSAYLSHSNSYGTKKTVPLAD